MAGTIFKEISFDHNGGPLEINFTFLGKMNLDYTYVLYDSDAKTRIFTSPVINKDDSNLNRFTLPLPVSDDVGRAIQLSSSFAGKDKVNFPDYSIIAELFQNGHPVANGKAIDTGKLDQKLQNSLIIITLT